MPFVNVVRIIIIFCNFINYDQIKWCERKIISNDMTLFCFIASIIIIGSVIYIDLFSYSDSKLAFDLVFFQNLDNNY
jgi:hypothetical protein